MSADGGCKHRWVRVIAYGGGPIIEQCERCYAYFLSQDDMLTMHRLYGQMLELKDDQRLTLANVIRRCSVDTDSAIWTQSERDAIEDAMALE